MGAAYLPCGLAIRCATMRHMNLSRFMRLFFLCLLAACQSRPVEKVTFAPARPVNFSGHWEVDYSRSDNVQNQLNSLARQLQRDAERRARAAERGSSYNGSIQGSGKSILALAEMAELITATQLLDVEQNQQEVRIKRDRSFALVCDLTQAPPVVTETPFGRESCGWDGHQMYFHISLPDGLDVRHRLTRSNLGDWLSMQTAVYSTSVSQPFVVNTVYGRYDPTTAGYRCTETLSKGRVCTTEQPIKQ